MQSTFQDFPWRQRDQVLRETDHVEEVGPAESATVLLAQCSTQRVDNLLPIGSALSRENVLPNPFADRPAERHHLRVDGRCGATAGALDKQPDVSQEFG